MRHFSLLDQTTLVTQSGVQSGATPQTTITRSNRTDRIHPHRKGKTMSHRHVAGSGDEPSSRTETGPIPLAALRWILITALALAAWAGAAATARSAALEFTDFDSTLAWLTSAAATFPVALSVMSACDRLFEGTRPTQR